MFKRKKCYYIINICENGRLTTVRCETFKEKEQWLIDYFTTEEKWWAWEKYSQWAGCTITFEKFVKTLVRKNANATYQSFVIRKGKTIIIQIKEKNN
jgi:hypothetical protein